MRQKVSLFLILLLFLSILPVIETQAQTQNVFNFTISIDKSEYYYGESILVSGTVNSTLTFNAKIDFYEKYKDLHEYAWVNVVNGKFSLSYSVKNVGYWGVRVIEVDIKNSIVLSNSVDFVVKYHSPTIPKSTTSKIASLSINATLIETSDYIRIYNDRIGAEISKSNPIRVKYYSPDFSKVLIYMEQIFLERFNTKTNKWGQVANQIYQLSYKKIENGYDVLTNCSDTYSNLFFEIHHIIRNGEALKIRADIKNIGTDSQIIRTTWSLDGIAGSNEFVKGCNLIYGRSEYDFDIKVSYQDIYNVFGNITTIAYSTSAQGRKRDFTFGNFIVANKTILSLDPSIVGTASDTPLQFGNWYRRTFYHLGRFWVFYSDGSNIVYKTSTDGYTWGSATTIASGDNMAFSIFVDYANNKIYYYRDAGTTDYERCGTLNPDGSITWDYNEVVINNENDAKYGYIMKDSSGTLWVACYKYYSDLQSYKYIYKKPAGGSWVSVKNITSTYYGAKYNTIHKASNGEIVSISTSMGGAGYANLFLEYSTDNFATYTSKVIDVANNIYVHSSIVDGNVIHIVYTEADASQNWYLRYVNFSTVTNSFSSIKTVASFSSSYGIKPSISKSSEGLYVFYTVWKQPAYTYETYNAKSTDGGLTWTSTLIESYQTGSLSYGFDIASEEYDYNKRISVVYRLVNNIKFRYVTASNFPKIGEFQAPIKVYANKYFYLNATIKDTDGINDFKNTTINLNGSIILKWDNATDTFSKYLDSNNYLILDSANCLRTQINATAYKLCFKIKLNWSYPEGYISIIPLNTKVFDNEGNYDNNKYDNLFYFEDDLIINEISVNKTRVRINQGIQINGTVYYEGTTIPPENTSGIMIKVELNGVLKGSTTTIDNNGRFSVSITSEGLAGRYKYDVCAYTDEYGVRNQITITTEMPIELRAKDSKGNVLALSPTTFNITLPNGTNIYRENESVGFIDFWSENGTLRINEIIFQGQRVLGTADFNLGNYAYQKVNASCWVYSLKVIAKSSKTNELLSGVSLTLKKNGVVLNGLYGLPSNPQTGNDGSYTWEQLANQSSSYEVVGSLASATPNSITTSLTSDVVSYLYLEYPIGGVSAPSGASMPMPELFKLFLKFLTKEGEKLLEGKVRLLKGSTLIEEKEIVGGKTSFTDLKEGNYTVEVYDKNNNLVASEEIYVDKDTEQTITVLPIPVEVSRVEVFWQNLREFLTTPPFPIIMIILLFFLLYIITKIPWKKAWEKEVVVYE
jgi:hypothetical protein